MTLKVISHNSEKTVGVASNVGEIIPIGLFSPVLLKEWAEKMIKLYGIGDEMYLSYKSSEDGKCRMLLANMEPGEDPYVVVAGACLEEEEGGDVQT